VAALAPIVAELKDAELLVAREAPPGQE
jgi:hypothetical protein